MMNIPTLRPAVNATPMAPPLPIPSEEGSFSQQLRETSALLVRRTFTLMELFSLNARNEYEILNTGGRIIGRAAENKGGLLGFLARTLLGPWRTFEIQVRDSKQRLVAVGKNRFRFVLNRFEILDAQGNYLGAMEQRWSLFYKAFDITDSRGRYILRMTSPHWKPWTFPLTRGSHELARVTKKWSGVFAEVLTDKEQFAVEFHSSKLSSSERILLVFCAIFVDVMYFEGQGTSSLRDYVGLWS
jgi:uncharacterized protein YxjI